MSARVSTVSILLLVVGLEPPAFASDAKVTCVNPASGTAWQIRIDYDRRTVDSNSANISDTEISWHDVRNGSNYTLDRKSGELTMVAASSTGGYFLHHHCNLDKPGR
ncbi:MAG TPA: hypothetical protein VGY58_08950 [Gemmataceae bacterium]|jgi:hypothetical protein|nr:hypothetical protein [Gemmataceae bacterium]